MTAPADQPSYSVGDHSQVGVQGENIIIEGNVQLTASLDTPPAEMYEIGKRNLEHGNPGEARRLIWDAMMRDGGLITSEGLFHWLVAMLSGRTARQFSDEEIGKLRYSRSRFAQAHGDAWADGVRLIYRLLDTVLDPSGPRADRSRLTTWLDGLGKEQRDMLLRLDLFLDGPRRDEMWRNQLQDAKDRQQSGDRLNRAWKFFHPDPVEVTLARPHYEEPVPGGRGWMRFSVIVFALLAGFEGFELIWQGAAFGLFCLVAGLAGGLVAAAGDLETRPRPEFRVPPQSEALPQDAAITELARQVDKLIRDAFKRCEPVEITRRLWWDATGQARRSCRDETVRICVASGVSPQQVAWFVRHEVWRMNRHWRGETPLAPEPEPPSRPRRGAVAARTGGMVALVAGFGLAVATAPGHLPGMAVLLASALWAWRRWLRVSLEPVLPTADERERDRRQADIDAAFRRWRGRLRDRPPDDEMARWLDHDRTILLGTALDQFQLPRSRVVAHGFLETRHPGARRSQIKGGLPRYQKYQIWMFLLAEDGVHQVRARLEFLTGTLVEREHISYGYASIAAVRMLRESGARKFELRLTAGEPIEVQVREPGPQNENADSDEEDKDITEESGLDTASVTNSLRLLQGVAGGGGKWLREHDWATAWSGE